MRKLIALVALLGSAASADAAEPQKWCSDGFDEGPAQLIVGPERSVNDDLYLTINGQRVEIRIDHEPDMTEGWFSEDGSGHRQRVWIVHSRVFWPCD